MKCTKCGYDDKGSGDMAHICEPVNTPQRTWVGLTDKDWNRSKHNQDFQKGVDWAEEMLKAKNSL